MLPNVHIIIKSGLESGLRSLSTANVHLKSSSVDATKIKSNNEYFKNMKINQEIASGAKPIGWDEALPFEKMPGPKPLPLLGNTWRLIRLEMKGQDFLDLHRE